MSLPSAGAEWGAGLTGATQSQTLPLGDISRIGEARRLAIAVAGKAGLGTGEVSDLGIVVTEIATNAVRHGGGGELIVRALGGARPGVEVLVLDRGPGMANVAECFRDGYSTGGTMGTGLGAARRRAHAFDIHSQPGAGTIVVARLWAGGPPEPGADGDVGAVCLPVAGETESGDGWAAAAGQGRAVVMAVDGLGHGSGAADAARLAVRLFRAHAARPPGEIMDYLHRGLKTTRGAAAAVAEIDVPAARLRYAGLGNIAARIVTDGGFRALVSHNGIVGHQARRVQTFEYPWTAESTLIMHSDGITGHWKAESWPGLMRRDPALLAGLIYRDFARERDDSSVVVFRQPANHPASRPQ